MVDAAREYTGPSELPRARRSAVFTGSEHPLPGEDRALTEEDTTLPWEETTVSEWDTGMADGPDNAGATAIDAHHDPSETGRFAAAGDAMDMADLSGLGELTGTAAFDATGDPSAMPSWDDLVREHADRVYRLAYRLSGDPQDAEDLTQETFIRVFRSLSNYQPGTFEGWLHRITTNLFLDMVRRRSRIRMEALPEDYERVAADGPGPEQVFHDARLDPDLQSALDSLAPEFRAAVVLCDIEGLSYEEIGATLGVKLGTVRSRIHRGRQALRDYLAHNGSQERFAAEANPG